MFNRFVLDPGACPEELGQSGIVVAWVDLILVSGLSGCLLHRHICIVRNSSNWLFHLRFPSYRFLLNPI